MKKFIYVDNLSGKDKESEAFEVSDFTTLPSQDKPILANNEGQISPEFLYRVVEAIMSGESISTFMPNPNSIETQIRNYTTGTVLNSDNRYAVYFTDTSVVFVSAVNPFAPKIVATMAFNTGGGNFPQAITTIGDYIYIVTATGRLYCYLWQDKLSPQSLGFITIGSGQHFDVTTDLNNTLFIANTTNKRVYIVDITNRSAGSLITSLVLGAGATDFGTGVSYFDGRLYAANYNNKIHVMKIVSGNWTEVTNFGTIVNPCRILVATNSKGQRILFCQRYNGVNTVFLDLVNPDSPVELIRVSSPASIQIYNWPFMYDDMLHVGLDNGTIGVFNIFEKSDIKYQTTIEPKNPDGTKKFSSTRGLVKISSISPFIKSKTLMLVSGVIQGQAATQKVTTTIELPAFKYLL